ncbi:hypothetical protein GALMADRAFT_213377 [Galerina marginata CBS 339.88]|uniref:Uncharacterized protein n=1 Tax=Galerina marginata (strain CBS 339.88) TaxID=685588 RepID=A0A067SQT0_GALM3|nr:hypothetical protein GALMADRAFT_213377 [Galerina marginata CBS 339.88]
MSATTFEFESTDENGVTAVYTATIPNFGTCVAQCVKNLRAQQSSSTARKPLNFKMVIFLPEALKDLYSGDELYDPDFAENNQHLELVIRNTTYVAVDQVELQTWQEVIEVEWLGRGAPWLAISGSSLSKLQFE